MTWWASYLTIPAALVMWKRPDASLSPPRLPALCSGFHARNGIYIHIRYAIYFN